MKLPHIPNEISENLRFLNSEVILQVTNLQLYLKNPSIVIAKHILDRSGYFYNLRIRIQQTCSDILVRNKISPPIANQLKALHLIAHYLTEIAECCEKCVINIEFIENRKDIYSKKIDRMLDNVIEEVGKIETSIYDNDTTLALEIGLINEQFRKKNRKIQIQTAKKSNNKKSCKNILAMINMLNTMMQMGDALRNISEIILSANLGQPINTQRYHSLNNTVQKKWGVTMDKVQVETIAQTRSGSGISGINAFVNGTATEMPSSQQYDAIFKEGKRKKLKEEKDKVKSWHKIIPGIAPRIIDYQKQGDNASILIEHLPGYTYEDILLHHSDNLLSETRKNLSTTLIKIWKQTYNPEKIPAGYISQLRNRLDSVYSIHPEFIQLSSHICGHHIPSFDTLLAKAAAFELEYAMPPFSVYIHGDFNLDNIIYDPTLQKINFIDLHRSRYMDYIQDISVFMVSNYRLQVLDPPLRKRILETALFMYHFTAQYAKKMNDSTFNIRLALGLARSFTTSTRFIIDKSLAEAMYLRARYLIDSILTQPKSQLSIYQPPIQAIFTG